MKRVTVLMFSGLLVASSVLAPRVSAQPQSGNNALLEIERRIGEDEKQVASWRLEERLEICSVIAVIAFGVVISALQGSKSKWAKGTTLVLGAVAAILTGVNSRVFEADDRTLRYAAFEGESIVNNVRLLDAQLKDGNPSTQDLTGIKGDLLTKLSNFDAIGERLNGTNATNQHAQTAVNFEVLMHVYAQTSLPGWVDHPPSDKTSLYFVGKASDASYVTAKQNSLGDAIYNAVLRLRPQAPDAQVSSLIALVKASGVIQDSAFTFDQKTRKYGYFTLLRLSQDIQNIGVRSLPAATVSKLPRIKFEKKGWDIDDLTSNSISGIFAMESDGEVSKLSIGSKGTAKVETLFRLPSAYEAHSISASSDAIFVSSQRGQGCIVHRYSLATKQLNQKVMSDSDRCFGIATDGRAVYVSLPDRNEIRYWDTWDAPSTNTWSVAGAKSPGYLFFDGRGNRLLLADADGRAYAISVPAGESQPLASNLGYVNGIAASQFQTLVASGDKVLFLARSDNHGENPPPGLQSFPGGRIVGVAVDADDNLWIADYDLKVVEGPFPLI